MFEVIGVKVVYNTKVTLENLIGNPKIKPKSLEKYGKYKTNCTDCNKKYYG